MKTLVDQLSLGNTVKINLKNLQSDNSFFFLVTGFFFFFGVIFVRIKRIWGLVYMFYTTHN